MILKIDEFKTEEGHNIMMQDYRFYSLNKFYDFEENIDAFVVYNANYTENNKIKVQIDDKEINFLYDDKSKSTFLYIFDHVYGTTFLEVEEKNGKLNLERYLPKNKKIKTIDLIKRSHVPEAGIISIYNNGYILKSTDETGIIKEMIACKNSTY